MVERGRTGVWVLGLLLGFGAGGPVGAAAAGPVTVKIAGARASIENSQVRVDYNLATGAYQARSRTGNLVGFTGASASTDDLSSSNPGLVRTAAALTVHDGLGDGRALVVKCRRSDGMTQVLEIALYPGRPFLALTAGVINGSKTPVHLKEIHPLTGASAFPHAGSWNECKTLNGASGGAETRVQDGRTRRSINDLLLTFLDKGRRRSLVAGGLTYHDYVKYAALGPSAGDRPRQIQNGLPQGQVLAAYLDCGAVQTASGRGVTLGVTRGKPYTFGGSEEGADPACGSVVFDDKQVVLDAADLQPGKPYRLGWSWWDYDGNGRVESVVVETPDGSKQVTLVNHRALPAWRGKQQGPEQLVADIPSALVVDGRVRIRVTNDAPVPNAVVSEAWIVEAPESAAQKNSDGVNLQTISVHMDAGNTGATGPLPLDLDASDPVGRLVEPGATYLPDDRFYVDFSTANPFQALEQYGLAVRAAQGAHPNLYSFPTVCAWYVEVYDHGPKINNTAGLVQEMDRVKASGFLKYAPVALRLVPDTYTPDNEQGWWDDAHWQRYGHYTRPYETSALWGKAIIDRGGLPFTYVQTGFISGDFAKAHPDYMLFKSSKGIDQRYKLSAWSYGYDQALPNYDYTSAGFQQHLLKSWSHLREGGVQGVMFDYPESAWHPGGGFADPHATCAAAYRDVFRICREGLGPHAWIHERNIGVGQMPLSDLSVGLVDSQRVWTDNSTFQPGMVAMCALRWYKYRTLYSYDMDAKSLFATPYAPGRQALSARRRQAILTMLYVTAGRVLLANSFRDLTPDMLHDLSRLYPVQQTTHSARPVDAFTGVACPRIYEDAMAPGWDQVTLFNPDFDKPATISTSLAGDQASGALGLDPHADYYVYDFWNDRFVGRFSGRERLTQVLDPGEARVLSVHRVERNPQVLSTNRHITQGAVDMTRWPHWDSHSHQLSGTSAVVGGEPYVMVMADNGLRPTGVTATGATARTEAVAGQPHLVRVILESPVNQVVSWAVTWDEGGQKRGG